VLAGCGEKEASVLDRAFEREVKSAQLSVDVRMTEGAARKELGRFSLRGPFQAAPTERELDRFDWTIRASGHHGERLAARVTSTGDNVFVRYRGKTYEVGEQLVANLERQAARERRKGGQVEDLDDLQRLGLDLRSWFPKSADEGASTAAGVPTTRITGQLDVSKMLEDFNVLLRKPAFRGQFKGQVAPRLGKRDIREVDDMVSDPRMEVHVGRDDGKFRRVAARMRFEIPEKEREGAAFGNLSFVMEWRDVDRPVAIDAPANGRPIFELLRKLEGMGGGHGGGKDAADLAPA
jgi:hypothetical protein